MAGNLTSTGAERMLDGLLAGASVRVRLHRITNTDAPAVGNHYGQSFYSAQTVAVGGWSSGPVTGNLYDRLANTVRIAFGTIPNPAPAQPTHVAIWSDHAIANVNARLLWWAPLTISDWEAGRNLEIGASGIRIDIQRAGADIP